jgi:FkbM family methyltransferase
MNSFVEMLDLRPADMYIWNEIFVDNVYENILPPMPSPNILDLGANVGIAALWFSRMYQDARIFCVEPDPHNFELLKKNISILVSVKAVRFAVHNKCETLEMYSPECDSRPCALRTRPSKKGLAYGMPIDNLITLSQFKTIDLLKVDIEGAEDDLFLGEPELPWLKQVNHLVVEVHDQNQKRPLIAAIENNGFKTAYRELSRLIIGRR